MTPLTLSDVVGRLRAAFDAIPGVETGPWRDDEAPASDHSSRGEMVSLSRCIDEAESDLAGWAGATIERLRALAREGPHRYFEPDFPPRFSSSVDGFHLRVDEYPFRVIVVYRHELSRWLATFDIVYIIWATPLT